MRKVLSFFFFVGIIAFVWVVSSYATTPDSEWYSSLQKPFFQPPKWVFAPVWALLYIFMD